MNVYGANFDAPLFWRVLLVPYGGVVSKTTGGGKAVQAVRGQLLRVVLCPRTPQGPAEAAHLRPPHAHVRRLWGPSTGAHYHLHHFGRRAFCMQ